MTKRYGPDTRSGEGSKRIVAKRARRLAKQKIEEAMPTQNQRLDSDQAAVVIYAVLGRDSLDFLDMCDEASDETLANLYLLLSTPSEKQHDACTKRLNKVGAQIVAGIITNKRGNKLPEPVGKPDPTPGHGTKPVIGDLLTARLKEAIRVLREDRNFDSADAVEHAVNYIQVIEANHKACSKMLQEQMDACDREEARAEAVEAERDAAKKNENKWADKWLHETGRLVEVLRGVEPLIAKEIERGGGIFSDKQLSAIRAVITSADDKL